MIVCPAHGCVIKEYASIDKLPLFNRFYLLRPADLDLYPCQIEDREIQTRLIDIANQANLLLNINFNEFDIDSVRQRYHAHLKEKGFLTNVGHVRIQELCHQVKQYYGENLLSAIKSDFDSDDCKNWIRGFFGYKNVLLHPIRHILLINFLCGGVNSFFDGHSSYDYFGEGPWPCLNPAAKHYKQLVVSDLKIAEEYKTKKPVGTFSCTCGFIFSRRGPDVNPEDKYKVGSIKQYGHEWEEKLKDLILRQNMSLRAISRALKCDSKTVVKYGGMMGLENYISSSVVLPQSTCSQRAKRDYRNEFEANVMQLIRSNPMCDKKLIKEKLPKEFSWLVKYDLNWLNRNVPVQCNFAKEKGYSKVNWNEVDAQILFALQKAYTEIVTYEYPQRVTKTLLGRVSGRLYYLKNKIDLLPQSQAFMNTAVETFEQYKGRI